MAKSFLVIDTGGLHPSTALRLAQDGNTVYYWNAWLSAYPRFEDYAPGYGLPNVKKVKDFGPYIDKVDAIMFPDIGMGGMAHTLREQGYPVFGAGRGEELEWNRRVANEVMDKIGIKRPETWIARGFDGAIEKLNELLKLKTETNQNAAGKFYVKFNVFRGSGESFPVADIADAHFMFDRLRPKFGPYSEEVPVFIQRSVEGVECGMDCFFDGEKFVAPFMVGFESGNSYIGHITDDMSIYKKDMDKLAGYLRSVKYRGYYSFECFYDGTDCYFIDHTQRSPYPLGLIYSEYVEDFGKLVFEIANGKAESSGLPLNEYLGCVAVASEEALTGWLPLKGGEHTRFCRYMMVDDHAYSVPGTSLVAAVMGRGNSMDALQEAVIKEAEDLSIYFAQFNVKFVDEIRSKYIKPMADLGFQFGNEKVSDVKQEAVESPRHLRPSMGRQSFHDGRVRSGASAVNNVQSPAQSGLTIEEVVRIANPKELESKLMMDAARIVGAMK